MKAVYTKYLSVDTDSNVIVTGTFLGRADKVSVEQIEGTTKFYIFVGGIDMNNEKFSPILVTTEPVSTLQFYHGEIDLDE